MEIQNIEIAAKDGKLGVKWDLVGSEVRAITIALGLDSELTEKPRYFTVPPVSGSVALDVGAGTWYARLGAWKGSPEHGDIHWSGIYGPCALSVLRVLGPPPKSVFSIAHSRSLRDGYRLFTGRSSAAYAIVDYGAQAKFPASHTRSQYVYDWGKGQFDIRGLNADTTYSFRLSGFSVDVGKLPEGVVKMHAGFLALHGRRTEPPPRVPVDPTTRATSAADAARMRDASIRNVVKYISHEDYVRAKAAEQKLGGGTLRRG